MDENYEALKSRAEKVTKVGLVAGIGCIAATTTLELLNHANKIDVRPVFHLPLTLMGATLAISAAMYRWEIRKAARRVHESTPPSSENP